MSDEYWAFRQDKHIRERVQRLRKLYVPRPEFKKLENCFQRHIDQRRADDADGIAVKARGIMLVGQSGSGKTTAIRELIRKFSSQITTDPKEEICEYIGLQVTSPATLKFVGGETLRALGYPYSANLQGPVVWDRVKTQLELRATKFLGFDEAQDLARYETKKERQSVVNTLKSLMENSVWPVGLILSGMPELKAIVNQDAQLARRVDPVEIPRMHSAQDAKRVIGLIQKYASRASIPTDQTVQSEQFAQRLMHAADHQFGLLAEIIVLAASHALFSQGLEAKLSNAHFAQVFAERNGADPWMNIFIAEDFGRINPRLLLDDGLSNGLAE